MPRTPLIVLIALAATGCVYRATDIPVVASAEATGEQVYILAGSDQPDWEAATSLAHSLQEAGFRPAIVGNADALEHGVWLIDGISPRQCLSEPVLTVFTLGVVPHIGCSDFGYVFQLSRKGEESKVRVNARYTVETMVGWLTWPAALRSDYVFNSTTLDIELCDSTTVNLLRRELSRAMQGGLE